MGLFDWFAADIACPACGARTGERSTGAQTKLHPSPHQNYLTAGDELVVTPDSAEDARYTVLRPHGGGDVRILQNWECPNCAVWPPPWLEVRVLEGRIASIAPVEFLEGLARAHYIEDESLLLYAAGIPGAPPLLNDTTLALRLLRPTHPGRAGP
ncbi:MAG: hypothetical protein FD126_3348 [Elusimicrobia bacterium]|nr:MAG: hypothetical protein FD126_3348 [Elusimicrobiota bacterium]